MPPTPPAFKPGQQGFGISIDPAALDSARAYLAEFPRDLPKATNIAINRTATEVRTRLSDRLRERVNIKKRDIDPHLKIRKSTIATQQALLTISESERLPLKYFGARQTKAGVTYRIEKSSAKRTLVAHAFIIKALGDHVFIRGSDKLKPERMKKRIGPKYSGLPITKLKGPSPWGVFVKSGLEGETLVDIRETLSKNLRDSVAFMLKLRAGGIAATGSRAALLRDSFKGAA